MDRIVADGTIEEVKLWRRPVSVSFTPTSSPISGVLEVTNSPAHFIQPCGTTAHLVIEQVQTGLLGPGQDGRAATAGVVLGGRRCLPQRLIRSLS